MQLADINCRLAAFSLIYIAARVMTQILQYTGSIQQTMAAISQLRSSRRLPLVLAVAAVAMLMFVMITGGGAQAIPMRMIRSGQAPFVPPIIPTDPMPPPPRRPSLPTTPPPAHEINNNGLMAASATAGRGASQVLLL
ncbi:hypothetical protein BS78_03G151600 [Paspalum vaginatum]|nr:hypothetical protein BS78_03G151600 [Paspalum vaginatum]